MSREVHVRFCERRGVRFPPATLLWVVYHRTTDHAEELIERNGITWADSMYSQADVDNTRIR